MTAATCEVSGPSDAPLSDIGGIHHINPERSLRQAESQKASRGMFRLQRQQKPHSFPPSRDRSLLTEILQNLLVHICCDSRVASDQYQPPSPRLPGEG